jgi:peptide/nickel transport system permease protein
LASAVTQNIWVRFLVRRLLSGLLVLVVLVCSVFVLVHLVPGDPVVKALGPDAPQATIDRIRAENGFDQPLGQQFTRYLSHLAQGDLGRDFVTGVPVSETIGQRIGGSLQIAGAALVLVLAVSIPLGMLAGALTREGRRRRLEVGFVSVTSVFSSIPDYLIATVLAFLFAVQFQLFPVADSDGLDSLVLPVLAVSLHSIMSLTRLVRLETLNVLAQDYIRTARSERLPARLIYTRHALPNVVTAALTLGGVIFANLIGGAVVVENVFGRTGLGTALVSAVTANQYVVVQGITLVLGVIVIVANLLVDITLGIMDPRSLAKRS